MITAQNIREKTFDKVRIGGYDMASVDDFLEELADDITNSQKENAVLKSKMKVLVDKIEEYRANEEALNLAVLSAQKLAVQIEADARTRAAAMIADADRQVKLAVGSIEEKANAEEKRLADAQAATAQFLATIRSMCSNQIARVEDIISGDPALQADDDEDVRPARKAETKIAPARTPAARIQDQPEEKTAPARQRRMDDQPFSF